MVLCGQQRVIRLCRGDVLRLFRSQRRMGFMRGGLLRGGGTGGDAASAAVETDARAGAGVGADRRVVDGCHVDAAKIVRRAIVGEGAVIPASALIAVSAITEAVIDAAVESDGRAPISAVPEIGVIDPAPITRSPEIPDLGRRDPGARNPEITAIAVSPIARSPDIAELGKGRLGVNRQHRRRDLHGNADIGLRDIGARRGQQKESEKRQEQDGAEFHDGALRKGKGVVPRRHPMSLRLVAARPRR